MVYVLQLTSLVLFTEHLVLHSKIQISISLDMPQAPKHLHNITNSNTNTTHDNNKRALKFIEEVTSNTDEIQTKVLYQILSRSAQVEYLQRQGLDGHTDRNTFKKVMPVVTYEDLKPDIDRIANGDASPILCSKPISEFLTRWISLYTWT